MVVIENNRIGARSAHAALSALCVASCVALAACSPSGDAKGGEGGKPPPPQVGVVTVQAGTLALTTELPGRLEASREAQVRARVTGIVQKRRFEEGALVRAGQPLFEIDAAPYRAALDSARAVQTRAEATLDLAQATLERNRPLAEARAISQQEWITTQAQQQQAAADLLSARAAVQTARLGVDYAAVTSPIAGRIGRALVSEGALVTQAEATPMALVQQVDPMYVDITQSAADALRLRRAISQGRMKAATSTQVQVVMDDGTPYPLPAKLLFTDVTVDPTSGQVALRAEVPNPKGELLPGLYVKVRLEQAQADSAILIPQQAATRTAAGDTVLVVGADNLVAQRQVKLGGARGNQWIVLGGLAAGERVVVDGFQKIKPKAPVSPVPWAPPAAAAAAGASTAASAASR